MTIKEAFEMLAKSTKKGMKNPFFVMRGLSKNFSDIAENIEEGGGGSSAWTLAGSGTGTGSSARITLPEANEYLFIAYYSSTFYSVIAHPSNLINGAVFRTGFYLDSSYNAGIAFAYDAGTKKIRLGNFKQNGSDVSSSATIYAYYR